MKNKTLLIATAITLGFCYFYFSNDYVKYTTIILCYGFLIFTGKILFFSKDKEGESTLDDFIWIFSIVSFFGGILVHSFGFWLKDPLAPVFIYSLGLSVIINIAIAAACWLMQVAESSNKNKEDIEKDKIN